jgi:hypothetical protein
MPGLVPALFLIFFLVCSRAMRVLDTAMKRLTKEIPPLAKRCHMHSFGLFMAFGIRAGRQAIPALCQPYMFIINLKHDSRIMSINCPQFLEIA